MTDYFELALSDYPFGMRQSWHEHDQFVIAMTLRGLVREQVGRNDSLITPYQVGIKPSGVRHSDHFSDKGVRVLRLALSTGLESELRAANALHDDWTWEADPAFCRPMFKMARRILLDQVSGIDHRDEIFEFVATLRPRKSRTTDPPRWLEHARDQLESTFAEGTRLSHLSTAANVHPAYFARRFNEFYGCSVGTYVRRLQLKRTTELLTAGKFDLADIALIVGFSDQAHLTRSFLNEFGLTPGKLRKFLK